MEYFWLFPSSCYVVLGRKLQKMICVMLIDIAAPLFISKFCTEWLSICHWSLMCAKPIVLCWETVNKLCTYWSVTSLINALKQFPSLNIHPLFQRFRWQQLLLTTIFTCVSGLCPLLALRHLERRNAIFLQNQVSYLIWPEYIQIKVT